MINPYRVTDINLDPMLGSDEFKIGNRIYKIILFVRDCDVRIQNPITRQRKMVRRAKKLKAYLGDSDCRYVLDHQKDIPSILCDPEIRIFFSECMRVLWSLGRDFEGYYCYIYHSGDNNLWHRSSASFFNNGLKPGTDFVLRRIK